jgi:hypothetical protein
MKEICKNCSFWKKEQAELEYSRFTGICTCYKWQFTTTNDSACFLLDRENKSKAYNGTHRFENQNKEIPIGSRNQSRYCLVTDEKFGCIHFEKKT